MTKFRKENTDRLLDLYYSGKLDKESKEIIQGWLFSDDNRMHKDANIAMLFRKVMSENRKPDDYTRRSLAAMQEELGFIDRKLRRATTTLAGWKPLWYVVGTVAAVAAIIIGVPILPGLFDREASDGGMIADVTITAEHDSTKEITLPDGSAATLKGATTIVLAANFAENRRVRIDGEAYFTVVPDEEHPFTVEGDDMAVTVLGTEFNMKAFKSETFAEVILTTGKLKVISGDRSITLNPSEVAKIDKTNHAIELSRIGDGKLLRLRGMDLSLKGVSLSDAFEQIGEFYQVTMTVSADVPHIDGIVVKLDGGASLDETLFILQAINPVFEYRIDGNMVTITKF